MKNNDISINELLVNKNKNWMQWFKKWYP